MFPGDPGSTLFDAVCDIENIRLAHYNASRGKQWYPEVKMVNKDIDFYINEIHEMLVNKTYINSSYDKFERHENGKIRLIHKLPYYPDRIIQWALLQVISPILEKNFIRNTYSSIPGRGPIKCMLDVSNAMHKDPYNTQYCLKIDIHHFYQSINHDVLKQKYRRLFKDNELINVVDDYDSDDSDAMSTLLNNMLKNVTIKYKNKQLLKFTGFIQCRISKCVEVASHA